MMAVEARVEPSPASALRSRTTVLRPIRASSSAIEVPTIPAPMTTASAARRTFTSEGSFPNEGSSRAAHLPSADRLRAGQLLHARVVAVELARGHRVAAFLDVLHAVEDEDPLVHGPVHELLLLGHR